jgi:alkanesulfonate monooxygenase SsuD/methylene tetrahydromethanopterin reductase-like flavin-dependent oxidoreductase (luciferase family)
VRVGEGRDEEVAPQPVASPHASQVAVELAPGEEQGEGVLVDAWTWHLHQWIVRLGRTTTQWEGGRQMATFGSIHGRDREGGDAAAVRSGLFVPLFDELADPVIVAGLAAEAEEAGWHGFFVWDHVRWQEPVLAVADPWITLAAIATATERIRLGPLVTPLARRRPVKVARETATLDHLSRGRLTMGVGLGSDRYGSEFSLTGEEVDDRRRAEMLDESLEILTAARSGEPVHHRGKSYTVDGMRLLPRPVQRPSVPIWVAGYPGKPRPMRRAVRYQGFFPVNLERPDQLAEIVADLAALRTEAGRPSDAPAEPYDIVAALPPDTDRSPYRAAGATWVLVELPWDAVTVDLLRSVIRAGPFHG